MVDAESFPAVFPSYPQLAEKGAYSADAVYEVSDMQTVVQAALERGIRVVPEFDVPGHAYSWGNAFPNITVFCANYWANSAPPFCLLVSQCPFADHHLPFGFI